MTPPTLSGPISTEDWYAYLDAIIAKLESTNDSEWLMGRCRSEDGTQNCLLGHVFNMGADDKSGNQWANFFESCLATTFMFFPVNDGEDEHYQQPTPRERCIAYVRDLRDGRAKTVLQLEQEQWAYCQAQEGKRDG